MSLSLKKSCSFPALALLTLCFGVTASADVTWTLNDVVFNDGGQAVGSFTLNSSGDPVSWDIAVSGGDTAAYPAVTFTTGEPTDFKGASQPEFANAPFTLYLVLGTLAPLTNAGGIVDLDPNNALDCNNGPCRVMTSAGFLSSGAAPEPVSVALAGVGLMCVALRRRLIK